MIFHIVFRLCFGSTEMTVMTVFRLYPTDRSRPFTYLRRILNDTCLFCVYSSNSNNNHLTTSEGSTRSTNSSHPSETCRSNTPRYLQDGGIEQDIHHRSSHKQHGRCPAQSPRLRCPLSRQDSVQDSQGDRRPSHERPSQDLQVWIHRRQGQLGGIRRG